MDNLVEYIGLTAALCTTLAYLPQALKVWQTKQTKDVSMKMYVLVVFGNLIWIMYGLLIKDAPIVIANIVITLMALSIVYAKRKFEGN